MFLLLTLFALDAWLGYIIVNALILFVLRPWHPERPNPLTESSLMSLQNSNNDT